MKKRYILACLLALLLCACETHPPAVSTDALPTETSSVPETGAVTTTAPETTTETVITRPETIVRYTAEAKDLTAIADMEAIVQRDREDVEFAITLTNCDLELYGTCTLPEGEETAVTHIRSVKHCDKIYPVLLTDEMICSLALFVTDDVILLGQTGYAYAWSAAYFFYDGGACGYSGKELLADRTNDDLMQELSAFSVGLHFSLENGVLQYKKIYHPNLRMTADDCLPFRFGGHDTYSVSGTVTLAENKLTITEHTVTTIAEELEPVWKHAGMDSFEAYVESVADSLDPPRYTLSMNRESLDKLLESIQEKAISGESYPTVYEVEAEEDSEILLRIYCIRSGDYADNILTQVTYHGKTYDVVISAFAGAYLDILYLPDLLIFGEHGGSAPGGQFYLFYDGGMCGYGDGIRGYGNRELLLDGVNDEVVTALRAPSLDFTIEDGVLHYAKYYHYGIVQAAPMVLEYADRPDALYSEEGTLTFDGGKLTMTLEKTTTIEDFAEQYYDDYGVTNFADLMQAMKNE